MGPVLSNCQLSQEQEQRDHKREETLFQSEKARTSPIVISVTLFRMKVIKEQAVMLRCMSVGERSTPKLLPVGSSFDRRKRWREWRPRKMMYIGQAKIETDV